MEDILRRVAPFILFALSLEVKMNFFKKRVDIIPSHKDIGPRRIDKTEAVRTKTEI